MLVLFTTVALVELQTMSVRDKTCTVGKILDSIGREGEVGGSSSRHWSVMNVSWSVVHILLLINTQKTVSAYIVL